MRYVGLLAVAFIVCLAFVRLSSTSATERSASREAVHTAETAVNPEGAPASNASGQAPKTEYKRALDAAHAAVEKVNERNAQSQDNF